MQRQCGRRWCSRNCLQKQGEEGLSRERKGEGARSLSGQEGGGAEQGELGRHFEERLRCGVNKAVQGKQGSGHSKSIWPCGLEIPSGSGKQFHTGQAHQRSLPLTVTIAAQRPQEELSFRI